MYKNVNYLLTWYFWWEWLFFAYKEWWKGIGENSTFFFWGEGAKDFLLKILYLTLSKKYIFKLSYENILRGYWKIWENLGHRPLPISTYARLVTTKLVQLVYGLYCRAQKFDFHLGIDKTSELRNHLNTSTKK